MPLRQAGGTDSDRRDERNVGRLLAASDINLIAELDEIGAEAIRPRHRAHVILGKRGLPIPKLHHALVDLRRRIGQPLESLDDRCDVSADVRKGHGNLAQNGIKTFAAVEAPLHRADAGRFLAIKRAIDRFENRPKQIFQSRHNRLRTADIAGGAVARDQAFDGQDEAIAIDGIECAPSRCARSEGRSPAPAEQATLVADVGKALEVWDGQDQAIVEGILRGEGHSPFSLLPRRVADGEV